MRVTVLLGLACGLAAMHLIQLVDFGFGRDQAIYALGADAIWKGGAPYRDVWDFKPPGIFFLYAMVRGISTSEYAIRAFEAIAITSYIPAFIIVSRRLMGDGRAGVVAGALAIVCHVELEFWHTAQPESFGGVLLAWLLVVATHTRQNRSFDLVIGALAALATLLKPTIGVAALSPIALAVFQHRAVGASTWRRLTGIFVGAALPLGATYVFFATRDGLEALHATQLEFAPHYVALSWATSSIGATTWQALRQWLFAYSLPNVVGIVLFVTLAPVTQRHNALRWIGGMAGLLLVGIVLQAKLFAYHFGALLPLTALVAGWGFWHAALRARHGVTAAGVTVGALLLVLVNPTPPDLEPFAARSFLRAQAWSHPADRTRIRDRLYSVTGFSAADNRAASDWIRVNVPADLRVFVWGFAPGIYLESDRQPASRYIYNLAQRSPWAAHQAQADLVADLERSRPRAILVEHGDVFAFLTGATSDSAASLDAFPELSSMLAQHYSSAARIGKFDAYLSVAR
jgi:hypothetical protein